VKSWKVILATLVIFTAGLVTGGVLVKYTQPKPRREPPYQPFIVQKAFLERMKRELALTAAQVEHLEDAFSDSRERIQILWDMLGPEMQAEYRDIREKIRAELTAPQQEKFEKLLKERRGAKAGGPAPNDPHRSRPRRNAPGTNRPPVEASPPGKS
jgi:hypothetical protein